MSVQNIDSEELTKELVSIPKRGDIELVLGNKCDFNMFTTGSGGIAPGLSVVMDNGDRINFTFATDKAILELHLALAGHMSGMAKRLGSLFTNMHEHPEIGCKLTHELFNQSIKDAGQSPVGKANEVAPKGTMHH